MGIKEVVIKKSKWDSEKNNLSSLQAMPIIPKDDAYHGLFNFLDIEWWYFDAIFENGYSIHVGVRTFHTNHHGVVKLRIESYKDGKLVSEALQSDLFERFTFSKETPLVKHGRERVILFDEDFFKKTGQWRYHVVLKIENNSVDLFFTGEAKGWKFETPDTSWVVALPTAQVNGSVTIQGQSMDVKGIGYHDHNWDYSITTAVKNWGWIWGRITGSLFNLIWANTIQTPQYSTLLAVVSQKNQSFQQINEFININQKNISLTPKNFIYDHRRWIPTAFDIQIGGTIETALPVKANLTMELIDLQHSRIFTAHYWRYHMYTTGSISVGTKTETFEKTPQIVEFLSFKRQRRDHEHQ